MQDEYSEMAYVKPDYPNVAGDGAYCHVVHDGNPRYWKHWNRGIILRSLTGSAQMLALSSGGWRSSRSYSWGEPSVVGFAGSVDILN